MMMRRRRMKRMEIDGRGVDGVDVVVVVARM